MKLNEAIKQVVLGEKNDRNQISFRERNLPPRPKNAGPEVTSVELDMNTDNVEAIMDLAKKYNCKAKKHSAQGAYMFFGSEDNLRKLVWNYVKQLGGDNYEMADEFLFQLYGK
jgi:hypothetical protein